MNTLRICCGSNWLNLFPLVLLRKLVCDGYGCGTLWIVLEMQRDSLTPGFNNTESRFWVQCVALGNMYIELAVGFMYIELAVDRMYIDHRRARRRHVMAQKYKMFSDSTCSSCLFEKRFQQLDLESNLMETFFKCRRLIYRHIPPFANFLKNLLRGSWSDLATLLELFSTSSLIIPQSFKILWAILLVWQQTQYSEIGTRHGYIDRYQQIHLGVSENQNCGSKPKRTVILKKCEIFGESDHGGTARKRLVTEILP